jgi:integrase/recombinase XerD
VSQRLQTELANYLATRHINDPSIPFFHTDNRLGFSGNGLCVWFFQLYKNVGICGGSSHSGRKFFITTLANKGIGVRILASLAGHRSIAVTQRYIEVNDEQKRNAVELIQP